MAPGGKVQVQPSKFTFSTFSLGRPYFVTASRSLRLKNKVAADETATLLVKSTRYLPAGQEKTGFDCHLCTRYVLRYLHSPFEADERSFNLYRFQLELPCVPSRHDVQIEKRRAPSARLQVTSVWAYECSPAKCIVAPGPGILPVWADSSRH